MSDLQPGGAALVVLGEADNRERLVHDLGRHGGTLVSTDVSSEQIAEIQHEIDKVAAASKQSS
jgi:uncharacterized membrane protein